MKPRSHQHLQSTQYVKAHDRQISHCIGCDRQLTCIIFWLLRLGIKSRVLKTWAPGKPGHFSKSETHVWEQLKPGFLVCVFTAAFCTYPRAYLDGGEPAGANSVNTGLHILSRMFETSQREAFCDAWKALKSIFGRSSAPDPAG